MNTTPRLTHRIEERDQAAIQGGKAGVLLGFFLGVAACLGVVLVAWSFGLFLEIVTRFGGLLN